MYYKRSYTAELDCSVPHAATDDFPFEYPVSGRGDFRVPALTVTRQDGVCAAEPLFQSWRVLEGKPPLEGLHSTFAGDTPAKTLEIICEDRVIGLRVVLYYTVFENLGVVARHQRVENFGRQMLMLENVQSASLELPAGPWELLALYGTHAREANLTYSGAGLNGMSGQFHTLYRDHLMPRRFSSLERPVLLNSWESMYYDVSLAKIEEQAELARQAGVELFVLDDGWFRADNTSRTSMGDWVCNESKLPGGIVRAAQIVHDKGMKFGLWFEPEAVCRNSELYRLHPDWTLHIPGYTPLEGRHEYLLDRVTKAYPELLIEGCSSGGARFDPGMLYYVAQNWTSDNTDALDRLTIQDGFSLLYPPAAMGAHVSIAPNHQTGRVYGGDELMQLGLTVPLVKEDCHAFALHLERC